MKDKICPECGSLVPWELFEYTCGICGHFMEPTLEDVMRAEGELKEIISGVIFPYTIAIQCDHPNHVDDFFNGVVTIDRFTGYTDAQCVKQARAEGWIFHKDGKLTCPNCRRSSRVARVG